MLSSPWFTTKVADPDLGHLQPDPQPCSIPGKLTRKPIYAAWKLNEIVVSIKFPNLDHFSLYFFLHYGLDIMNALKSINLPVPHDTRATML